MTRMLTELRLTWLHTELIPDWLLEVLLVQDARIVIDFTPHDIGDRITDGLRSASMLYVTGLFTCLRNESGKKDRSPWGPSAWFPRASR